LGPLGVRDGLLCLKKPKSLHPNAQGQ
jgi:hypothetical protein